MTDYSKLSDAEIAERVCRKLGAPVGEDYYANLLWGTQQIPVHEDSFDFYRDYEDIDGTRKRLFAFLCFDWTAPIMMQKVNEWLKEKFTSLTIDITVTKSNVHVSITGSVMSTNTTGRVFTWRANSDVEKRSFYEVFLQVEE